jgi:hypothetical protein
MTARSPLLDFNAMLLFTGIMLQPVCGTSGPESVPALAKRA